MLSTGVCLVVIVVSSIQEVSLCPDSIYVLNRMFTCLENLTGDNKSHSLLAGSDVQHVKKQCNSGGFSRSVSCIQILLQNCTENKRAILKKIVDPASWKRGFDKFCEKFPEYESESLCLEQQDPEIHSCIANHTRKTLHNNYITIATLCKYFLGLLECSTRPVLKHCGKGVTEVISDVITGITPPTCLITIDGAERIMCHASTFSILCLSLLWKNMMY